MTRPAGALSGTSFTFILDTVGDGSGERSATGNYSCAPVRFMLRPPADRVFAVNDVMVFIRDTRIDANGYGGLEELTNGITLQIVSDDDILHDLTNGVPVRTTSDWAKYCGNIKAPEWEPGMGPKFFSGCWDFISRTEGGPLIIRGNAHNRSRNNERLVLTLNDDFRGLIEHTFTAKGDRLI